MIYKVKTQISLNKGSEFIPVNSNVTVLATNPDAQAIMVFSESLGRQVKLSWKGFAVKVLGKKVPSVKSLEKWLDDGVCKSIDGKLVEPDGYDENGYPSWLIVMGMV